MSEVIGCARVSTRDQNPTAQEAALSAAGAQAVFTVHGQSSRLRDRPQWMECTKYLRTGDTLLVPQLDRLDGTTTMAIELISDLGDRGINIRSLSDPMQRNSAI